MSASRSEARWRYPKGVGLSPQRIGPGPTRRYDILKEGSIAAVVVLILTVGLASLLSSPDVPPVTVASWVQAAPADSAPAAMLATYNAASAAQQNKWAINYAPPAATG